MHSFTQFTTEKGEKNCGNLLEIGMAQERFVIYNESRIIVQGYYIE